MMRALLLAILILLPALWIMLASDLLPWMLPSSKPYDLAQFLVFEGVLLVLSALLIFMLVVF